MPYSCKRPEYENATEDPTFARSKVNCAGCGALLHCQNKKQEGFMSADQFKSLTKHELIYSYCLRCDLLNSKSKLCFQLETNQTDYEQIVMKKICSEKKAHVILLIDLLDMPNSIYSGWSQLTNSKNENIDVCVIGNKLDLLPNTGPIFQKSIIECMAKCCEEKGIAGPRIKYVDLISAKTGYNVEKLISSLFEMFNDEGNVYLLGTTNAGKSLLFNQLLRSDYCRTLASHAISRAITSFWPGTTLNLLRLPITFLNLRKERLRAARLKNDSILFEKIDKEREKMYDKEHNLKDAELLGMIGSSFDISLKQNEQIDSELNSTYSLDSNTGAILEGENYANSIQVEEKLVHDARQLYRPKYYEDNAAYFYDTPGLMDTHEILK